MSAPTENDWNYFYTESFDNKVNVLYYYLCEGSYNMQEVANRILHDYNPHAPQRVSVITRCYGFGGNNKGSLRSIGATREDVVAFVRAYPNGCYYDGKGQVMRDFLVKRGQERNRRSVSYTQPRNAGDRTGTVRSNQKTYNSDAFDFSECDTYSTATMLRCGIVLALMFCTFKFLWGWNWILALVVAFFVVGLIIGVMEKFGITDFVLQIVSLLFVFLVVKFSLHWHWIIALLLAGGVEALSMLIVSKVKD
ncbi:MAG: hypothetical protein IJX95_10025 [Lachnospiraceae bacterium]|nr:hypothetical protein [Lachnospiraceae bacterium]